MSSESMTQANDISALHQDEMNTAIAANEQLEWQDFSILNDNLESFDFDLSWVDQMSKEHSEGPFKDATTVDEVFALAEEMKISGDGVSVVNSDNTTADSENYLLSHLNNETLGIQEPSFTTTNPDKGTTQSLLNPEPTPEAANLNSDNTTRSSIAPKPSPDAATSIATNINSATVSMTSDRMPETVTPTDANNKSSQTPGEPTSAVPTIDEILSTASSEVPLQGEMMPPVPNLSSSYGSSDSFDSIPMTPNTKLKFDAINQYLHGASPDFPAYQDGDVIMLDDNFNGMPPFPGFEAEDLSLSMSSDGACPHNQFTEPTKKDRTQSSGKRPTSNTPPQFQNMETQFAIDPWQMPPMYTEYPPTFTTPSAPLRNAPVNYSLAEPYSMSPPSQSRHARTSSTPTRNKAGPKPKANRVIKPASANTSPSKQPQPRGRPKTSKKDILKSPYLGAVARTPSPTKKLWVDAETGEKHWGFLFSTDFTQSVMPDEERPVPVKKPRRKAGEGHEGYVPHSRKRKDSNACNTMTQGLDAAAVFDMQPTTIGIPFAGVRIGYPPMAVPFDQAMGMPFADMGFGMGQPAYQANGHGMRGSSADASIEVIDLD